MFFQSIFQAVADPGFLRGLGAHPQGGGANLLFGQKFSENCMKIKEFVPRGGAPGTPLLDPPMPGSNVNQLFRSLGPCTFHKVE